MTARAAAPEGIPVVLFVLENFEPTDTFTGTVGIRGVFSFDNISLVEGLTYIATLDYQDVAYGSAFVQYDGVGEDIQLDIEVYEATVDPEVIGIGRLHIIVDFDGGNLRVSELYIFDNLGDRVFVGPSGRPGGGTVELPLPGGAMNPTVERSMGDSLIPATNSVLPGEGVFRDTLAVRPGAGSQQLMLSYVIPYDGEATVEHRLLYPAGSVSLFLPDVGLTVESDVLRPSGQRAMQGMAFVQWDAADLAAESTIGFTLSGEPRAVRDARHQSRTQCAVPAFGGGRRQQRDLGRGGGRAGDSRRCGGNLLGATISRRRRAWTNLICWRRWRTWMRPTRLVSSPWAATTLEREQLTVMKLRLAVWYRN